MALRDTETLWGFIYEALPGKSPNNSLPKRVFVKVDSLGRIERGAAVCCGERQGSGSVPFAPASTPNGRCALGPDNHLPCREDTTSIVAQVL